MSKITAAHLAPLAIAFDQALREGAITLEQAYDFCDRTYTAYLEQRARNGDPKAKHILAVHAEGVAQASRGNT